MRRSLRGFSVALAVLALAAQVHAGGFWLTLGNPGANSETRALNAAVTVKATGCVEPEDRAGPREIAVRGQPSPPLPVARA